MNISLISDLIFLMLNIHKNEQRKQLYINRHKNNENWTKSGINSAGFWSRWLLWHLPSITASYQDIKKRFNI